MARTAITVVSIARSGSAAGTEIPGSTAGFSFANDGRVFVVCRNASTSSKTVSFDISRTVDGQTAAARQVSLSGSQTKYSGPWPVKDYGTTTTLTCTSTAVKLTAYHF